MNKPRDSSSEQESVLDVDSEVVESEIAVDMLAYLRENKHVCAQVSIHAGKHPYIWWDGEQYMFVERVGYGELEVQKLTGSALVTIFASNPIDLKPVREATDSNGELIYERVSQGTRDEKVTVLS